MLRAVRVVLARPRDPRNIGAVCRAMKTMGLTRLWIAGDPPADPAEARAVAVHAADVLESAVILPTLAEALQGCALAVGVTRRLGRWRKQAHMLPEDLSARVAACAPSEVALVFGNEESGLSDAEMECCHAALTIPSSPLFPSLNLAAAVQIVAYALYRGLPAEGPALGPAVPDRRVDEVTQALMEVFREAGFFRQGFDSGIRRLFRDLLARSAMSADEADRVQRCLGILGSLVARKDGPGPGGP